MFNITPMVRNLLIINVVIFILQDRLFSTGQFALYHFSSEYFQPVQLFTHMFLHGGWAHVFSNMFSLFIFGPMLERFWGPQRFLAFYLITGLGASLLYSGVRAYELSEVREDAAKYIESPSPMAFYNYLENHFEGRYQRQFVVEYRRNPDNQTYIEESKSAVREVYNVLENTPMLGASGAVFGILMAFGLLFPNLELMLLFFPVPIKAKYFVLLYGAYELYAGFNRMPGDNVAHFAHLGGMLFAYILVKMWQRSDYQDNY
ncbi:membrane associated rhomboid family serine protease [Pontibacter aydingkolensis]|uniref:Rhomboid family intramembrane serine protease n=1 Tax=Pontibacter aydingkolensis TaxID=1911536 RepID=A0ABS7CRJ1_9BACT|nr:rhomboid family intramembrane serine protease [Pontibacter aydingkolensis]MBW7466410.1 rhomboid family intramembrane serine protease [Pontibacter aydingkolensis]